MSVSVTETLKGISGAINMLWVGQTDVDCEQRNGRK